MGLDADTLAQLTEEERAAIDDTPSEAELELLKAVAGDDDDDEGDDDNTGADAAAAAAAAAPAAAPAPAPAANAPAAAPAAEPAAAPAPAAQPAPAPAPTPTYKAELPADFDARKQAAADKESEAWRRFREGEIEQTDLQSELAAVSEERAALQALQTKAEISREMSAQTAEQQWQNAVTSFMDGVKSTVDYTTDTKRAADLDLFVRSLANDPANASQPMSWFLEEGHKRVLALHGLSAAPAPSPAPAQAPAAAPAPAVRKPDTSGLPPTLANVPGSDGPGDVSGEFTDIDKLSGFELEDAIRRMTPAQRERYSRGQ